MSSDVSRHHSHWRTGFYYGAGTLAFLFWPLLIPGITVVKSILIAGGIAYTGFIGGMFFGIYRCLRGAFRGQRRPSPQKQTGARSH